MAVQDLRDIVYLGHDWQNDTSPALNEFNLNEIESELEQLVTENNKQKTVITNILSGIEIPPFATNATNYVISEGQQENINAKFGTLGDFIINAVQISDWHSITKNGLYWSTSTATNAPPAKTGVVSWQGIVIDNSNKVDRRAGDPLKVIIAFGSNGATGTPPYICIKFQYVDMSSSSSSRWADWNNINDLTASTFFTGVLPVSKGGTGDASFNTKTRVTALETKMTNLEKLLFNGDPIGSDNTIVKINNLEVKGYIDVRDSFTSTK